MEMSEIDRIEGDLARTRERIGKRLDDLQHHLVPRQLVNDAFVRFRGGNGADFTDDLVARIKGNPLPAGIAALAVAWLMAPRHRPFTPRGSPIIALGPRPDDREPKDYIAQSDPEAGMPFAETNERTRHISTGSPPMTRTTRNTISSVTSNPIALGAGAALIGLIAGALIPTMRKEEEALGSVATKLRVAGRDLAQDVVDRGGHVVEETLGAVKGSADAHGLSSDKPIGEVFTDVKSGALAENVKQVAQEALQAGRDTTQAHLTGTGS